MASEFLTLLIQQQWAFILCAPWWPSQCLTQQRPVFAEWTAGGGGSRPDWLLSLPCQHWMPRLWLGQWSNPFTYVLNRYLLAWNTCISQSLRECVCDLGKFKVGSRLATLNIFALWPSCLQAAQALVRMCVTCSQMGRLLVLGKGAKLRPGAPWGHFSTCPMLSIPRSGGSERPCCQPREDARSFWGMCRRSTKLTQHVKMNRVNWSRRRALCLAEPSSRHLQWFVSSFTDSWIRAIVSSSVHWLLSKNVPKFKGGGPKSSSIKYL